MRQSLLSLACVLLWSTVSTGWRAFLSDLALRAMLATSMTITGSVDGMAPIQPTDQDNQLVQMAFRDFDLKRLDASEKEFNLAVSRWKGLHRPRDEIVSLLKARANVRLDNKLFEAALADYDECVQLMKSDGEDEKGLGRYPEYVDTFVGRGLAREGLADWEGAVREYDKAISLWGGQTTSQRDASQDYNAARYEGVNPYVLTFRGNALTRLNRYEQALRDYEASSNIFIGQRDIPRFSDARANYALTLYQLGQENEAVKVMRDVIRRNPGYADMHVAIAADAWGRGDYLEAMKEWRFTCDRIEVGCEAYNDMDWVRRIRRWPSTLADKLQSFQRREVPLQLTPQQRPNEILAPANLNN